MARPAMEQGGEADALAHRFLQSHGKGRVIVAIDSAAAAAADSFGADLVARLTKRGHSAFAARTNDFVAARDRRDALGGTETGEGRYRNTYDYSALRRVLIEPFLMGGSVGFVAAHYDRTRERQIQAKWLTAPDDSILVLSGEYLQRPGLSELWDSTVWLESPAPKPADAVDVAAQKLYAKDVNARKAANVTVVDVA